MRHFLAIGCFVLTFGVVGAASLNAQEATLKKTTIKSNELTFDYKKSTAIFVGDVFVQDPGIKMTSDRMNVLFDSTNEVKSVTASGNVRLWHDDITATCKRAIYQAQKGEVILMGDARLKRGDDVLRGDEITFWMDKEIMKCKPGYLEVMSNSEAPKLR
jgi:lipopolysaccharide transport protein LptA